MSMLATLRAFPSFKIFLSLQCQMLICFRGSEITILITRLRSVCWSFLTFRSWVGCIRYFQIDISLRCVTFINLHMWLLCQASLIWPSWIEISKWGYVHQWAPIENVYAWPCQGHIIKYWDLAAERSILTKFKIGPTAAILDRTKILLDVHQGPITCHNCAKYERDPLIHVWDMAVDRNCLTTTTTDDGRQTDTLPMAIAHRWAKNVNENMANNL